MRVLVTGSSRGLGRALARAYAEAGCGVVLHGRDSWRMDEARAELESIRSGSVCGMIAGDITSASIRDMVLVACRNWDVHVFVNNAGTLDQSDPARLIETNLVAPVLLTKAVYDVVMRPRGSGVFVNINSLAGKTFSDVQAVYCASKWGLRGYMGSFRYEARQHGVRVMDVYLGAMKTTMSADRPGWDRFIDPHAAARLIVAATLEEGNPSLAVNEIEIGRAQG